MNAWDALNKRQLYSFASVADDVASLRGDIADLLASGPIEKAFGHVLVKAFVPVFNSLNEIEASLRGLQQHDAHFFPAAAGRTTAPKPPQRPMLRIVK